jgi:ABC-type nitrate/sulfonate/bicarbonate transport system substrate-binding protein
MMNFRVVGSCVLVAAALSLCGASAAVAQSKPAPIRVVTPPLTNYTPLLVARDKGWFEAENIAVTWSTVTQTAVSIEAVYGGSAEFGGGGVLEPMIARGNGLDVMLALPTARIRSAPPDNSAMVVRANSDIQGAADLAGKKISVGLINSINHVHMVEWLKKRGVDPKTVQFIEIPFPQMADALLQNRLDAVWAVEPFLTIMRKSGNVRVIGYPYQDNLPDMDLTAFFAKETWLKANADLARRYKRAYQRGVTHLNDASKEERDGWVAKFTGVKPELVAEMSLPVFPLEFSLPSLRANMELAVAQRLIKPFDLETMVWKP